MGVDFRTKTVIHEDRPVCLSVQLILVLMLIHINKLTKMTDYLNVCSYYSNYGILQVRRGLGLLWGTISETWGQQSLYTISLVNPLHSWWSLFWNGNMVLNDLYTWMWILLHWNIVEGSITQCHRWLQDVREEYPNAVVMIVGNKLDLEKQRLDSQHLIAFFTPLGSSTACL